MVLDLFSLNRLSIKRYGRKVSMMRKMTVTFVVCCIVSVFFSAGSPGVQAKEIFVTIGGGDFTGVYFPTGLAIAKMIDNKRHDYGIRATVMATAGATFNLNTIIAGYMEFGITQADNLYRAFNGLDEWAKKGPQKELRSVFSLYNESLTLVAAVDAGINAIGDLKGKRVSLGNPGYSQRRLIIYTLEVAGLDPKKDIIPLRVNASEAPDLLQDNLIDAYFFTVGHPSETVRKALSGKRRARIIPIFGPGIDKLLADNNYYTKNQLQIQRLYPGLEGTKEEVESFGVKAILCTSSKVPEEVVYAVTKIVFENLDEFRQQHPALMDLTKEGMLKGLSAPLHPGALKYFMEAGLVK